MNNSKSGFAVFLYFVYTIVLVSVIVFAIQDYSSAVELAKTLKQDTGGLTYRLMIDIVIKILVFIGAIYFTNHFIDKQTVRNNNAEIIENDDSKNNIIADSSFKINVTAANKCNDCKYFNSSSRCHIYMDGRPSEIIDGLNNCEFFEAH